MNRSPVKIAAAVVVIVAILFMMVWVRAFIGSMRAWQTGESLFQEKKFIGAITFFDRSIHWYTPFNPYVERSAQRLWEIGTMAEKQGDVMLALIAFRTIRRGFYGTESMYASGKAWLDKSGKKIEALSKSGDSAGRGEAARSMPPPPDIFWSLVVEVGLLGWLGTMGILAVRLFRKNRGNRAPVSSRIGWGVLSLGFFIVWIVGLFKA